MAERHSKQTFKQPFLVTLLISYLTTTKSLPHVPERFNSIHFHMKEMQFIKQDKKAVVIIVSDLQRCALWLSADEQQ